MKITVSKRELYNKLKMVDKVVAPSKTLPILENYLFHVENGEMIITGSDASGMIQARVELVSVDTKETKRFIVDKTLYAALPKLADQPIELVIDETNHITVNYANGKFELQAMDADAFPTLTMPAQADTHLINRKQLIEGIKTVLPFVANDELRPVMNGVYMESSDDGKLTFVTTDAHVLASREYDCGLPVFGCIIPAKAAKIILSIVAEYAEEQVKVITSLKSISIETATYSIVYRLIEGRYPKFRSVIPKQFNMNVVIDKAEFLALIERVSVFSNISSRLLKINFNASVIDVFAQDIDYSISANETIFAQFDGSTKIGFHALRLAEVISAVETEQCEIKLIDASCAAIINPVGVDGVTLLIMPMLINS